MSDNGISIFIATPIHRATPAMVEACAEWARPLVNATNIPMQLAMVTNCPWLDAARADLVAAFMKTRNTHLLFRDDDIFFDASVMRALIDARTYIASAPYKTRRFPHKWVMHGLGAVLIHREAIEAMQASAPSLRYFQDGEERFALFHHIISGPPDQQTLLKEDAAFFYRAKHAGFIPRYVPAHVRHADVESVWPEN